MDLSGPMNESDQMEELLALHADLENRLASETESAHPDPALISDIKKQKLRLKDRIAELSSD